MPFENLICCSRETREPPVAGGPRGRTVRPAPPADSPYCHRAPGTLTSGFGPAEGSERLESAPSASVRRDAQHADMGAQSRVRVGLRRPWSLLASISIPATRLSLRDRSGPVPTAPKPAVAGTSVGSVTAIAASREFPRAVARRSRLRARGSTEARPEGRAGVDPRARARFCRGPPRSSRLFTPAMMRRPVGDVDPGGRCGDSRACAQGLVEVRDRAAHRPGSQDDREVPGRERPESGAGAELS